MRGAFVHTLIEIARADPRVMFLTGDLGFAVLEPLAEALPDRFFNCGVAEQNMVGIATGLAESGFLPFVYSIAPFATRRPYEFICNGPVLHNLPVRIVGVGGGFEYGHAGWTHHGIDDVALMRVLPNLSIVSPADSAQTVSALRATWDRPGPIYYRLGKDDVATVTGLEGRFRVGGAEWIRDGGDIVFLTMGSVANDAADAADELANRGIRSTVLVVASVRPEPADDIALALSRASLVLTVEAHSIYGGLGSMTAEIIAERGLACRLVRCGVRAGADGITGSNGHWNAFHGLSRTALVDRVMAALQRQ